MSKKTPQDYANELLKMYRENSNALAVSNVNPSHNQAFPKPSAPQFEDGVGGLQVNVTTFGRLYPVKDALVTVFTGDNDNKNILETSSTDESGKSDIFKLKTPPSFDSQQAKTNSEPPYSKYNISVKSDGYVEQIAFNIPVFSGVVSVQGIDLLPISAAGNHLSPQIIQEGNNYNL